MLTQPLHPVVPQTPNARAPRTLHLFNRVWRRMIDEIEVTHVRLPVRNLPPALSGAVACQISDFHLDRDEDLERLDLAVDLVNRQKPDFVFLTGDYFTGFHTMRRYLDAFYETLSRLAPAVGTFAVAGNHDHWASFDRIGEVLERADVCVLANSSCRIRFRGERLVVVGIDDLWSRRADPARAFAEIRGEECTVVLAHNPDTALYTRHLGPGVMLCGHTHGGVVRLPFYGSPLRSMLKIGRRYYAGLNRYGNFYIYTNRGLGTFWLRVRINCRPEVSCFALARVAETDTVEPRTTHVQGATIIRPTHHRPPRRGGLGRAPRPRL